ncbi:uncharacterized protein LOC143430368 [Xylocopa sonorina]|uniref:uncharacterized protein LOC143430368 n=1 Tax=Xylocopa sonorina TaxID=1818115 RepID=UPI00403AFA83
MESIIHDLQEDYINSSITGLFLVYPQYFIHVFEASENIIYRHLKGLYDSKIEDCEIVRSIFLPTYHHVHQRFFMDWFHVYMIPPSLLQKIESFELEDIQLQTSNCFNKVYSLCSHISNAIHDTSVTMDEVMRNIHNRIARLYPESTLLEYLLNVKSPVLLTVEEYLQISPRTEAIHFATHKPYTIVTIKSNARLLVRILHGNVEGSTSPFSNNEQLQLIPQKFTFLVPTK